MYLESGQVTVLYYFCFFLGILHKPFTSYTMCFLMGADTSGIHNTEKCLPICRKLTLIVNGTREKESHDMALKLPREC